MELEKIFVRGVLRNFGGLGKKKDIWKKDLIEKISSEKLIEENLEENGT